MLVPGQYSISGRRGKYLGFDNLSGSRIKQPPCYCRTVWIMIALRRWQVNKGEVTLRDWAAPRS